MKWLYKKHLKEVNSIQKVENRLGITFPLDYTNIVKEHNACTPSPNTIDTSRQSGKAFGELLNFNLDATENIISLYDELKNKLPEKVYPITMDPGGNFLCYDFREDENNPTIVRWDHEQKFSIEGGKIIINYQERESDYYHLDFVANNMEELLAKLYYDDIDEIDTSGFVTIWEDFLNEDELRELSDQDLADVNNRRSKEGLPPIVK